LINWLTREWTPYLLLYIDVFSWFEIIIICKYDKNNIYIKYIIQFIIILDFPCFHVVFHVPPWGLSRKYHRVWESLVYTISINIFINNLISDLTSIPICFLNVMLISYSLLIPLLIIVIFNTHNEPVSATEINKFNVDVQYLFIYDIHELAFWTQGYNYVWVTRNSGNWNY